MKLDMKKIIIISIVSIITITGFSQYRVGIGPTVRTGSDLGVVGKFFLTPNVGIQVNGVLKSAWNGGIVSGMCVFQRSIRQSKLHTTSLDFVVGLGGHYGRVDGTLYRRPDLEDTYFSLEGLQTVNIAGVSAIVGLEYTFKFPMSVALDIKPFYSLLNPTKDIFEAGFTVMFVLGER